MTTETALPITEQENPRSQNLSSQSTAEIVALMNEEDATVASAVKLVLAEGVKAGGYDACYRAVEASEDNAEAGGADLKQRGFAAGDVLVGIAASGRTPYTVGAVTFARSLGAFTIALTCVPGSPITQAAELSIVPVVGPEVVTGSSRLKAGTAQKMILNMISTATMVRLGYVSGNRMSNLQARNVKLRERAVRIVMGESGVDEQTAAAALEAAGFDLRLALTMIKSGGTKEEPKEAV